MTYVLYAIVWNKIVKEFSYLSSKQQEKKQPTLGICSVAELSYFWSAQALLSLV